MQTDHITGAAAQDHLIALEASMMEQHRPDAASMSPVQIKDQAMSCLD